MSELKQVIKELDFQSNFVGSMFLKPPQNNFSRVNLFGEISSLSQFQSENLYLYYEFALPIGWKVDNENEYYIIYQAQKAKEKKSLDEENMNKLKSVSQVSKGYVNPDSFSFAKPKESTFHYINTKFQENEDIIKDQFSYSHNLCFPFEIELLGHNDAIGVLSPKLLIQVNSVDSWNRHRIEGYCFINIPIKTGFYSFDVSCYKPKEDTYMKIFSYFLGGSRKIPDLKELAKAASTGENNVSAILNRYGIMTEFSGIVHININCVIQNNEIMEKARNFVKGQKGIQDFNLVTGINSAIGSGPKEKDMSKQDQMQTTQHGLLNRYGQ